MNKSYNSYNSSRRKFFTEIINAGKDALKANGGHNIKFGCENKEYQKYREAGMSERDAYNRSLYYPGGNLSKKAQEYATWEEIIELAKKLTAAGINPKIVCKG
jgi:ABC-type glycerol-3-phosphate transport system substrate-binding protein